MLNISLTDKPPSVEERCNIMRYNIMKGGVPVDYDRLLEYVAHTKVETDYLGQKLLVLMNSKSGSFSKDVFHKWRRDNGLTKGFNLTGTGNISLDAHSLSSFVSTNSYGDEVSNIVKMVSEYISLQSQILPFPSILEANGAPFLESEDGRRVLLLKPGVEPQNTGRFGLVGPAVMNFPRYMKDLYVAPKGWTIVHADSGQIEPKIIYGFYIDDMQINELIRLYGDAYYAILHYCTMDISGITRKVMNFNLAEIDDTMKELRAKLKTYGNAVMYGATSNRDKDPLKQSYIDRIGNHPKRIEWSNRLEREVFAGKRIFETIFGTPIDIYKSEKYLKATTEDAKSLALLHCAINNPIQGTAGDLMAFSLKASNDLFKMKSPNSWITKFSHDEGGYCIYNEEKDYVMEDIMGHTAYNIDDKVIITNDPVIGRKIRVDKAPCSYSNLVLG